MSDFIVVLLGLIVFGLVGLVLIISVLKILYTELGIKESRFPTCTPECKAATLNGMLSRRSSGSLSLTDKVGRLMRFSKND